MKKSLLYTVSVALMLCVLLSLGFAVAESCTIQLDVEFESNRLFSKYDVDVFLDANRVGTYEHGKNFTVSIPADEGNHTLRFLKENGPSTEGSIEVNVDSDVTVKCHIECKRDEVSVTEVQITRDDPAPGPDAAETPEAETPESAADDNDTDDIGNTKITNDGIRITLISAAESAGNALMPPKEGNIYLLLDLLIENNSPDSVTISNIANFDGVCDGCPVPYSFGAYVAVNDSVNGIVPAGEKKQGQVAFEVPKDWQEFELHVSPDMFKDGVVFAFRRGSLPRLSFPEDS